MKFKRSSTRRIVIIGVIVLALAFACDTYASPLYGGYNGKSDIWVEFYIFEETTIGFSFRFSVGLDPNLNVSWIRIGVSSLFLLPYNISNIGFSYETGDIASASLTTLLPWPLQFGADTNNLQWIITNLLIFVVGVDTDGNMWWERGIPGVWAYGGDSNDNQWQWIKLFSVLLGMKVNLTSSNQGISLGQENSLRFEEKLRSLQDHFVRECGPKLSALLTERLTDDEIMENIINLAEALNDRIAVLPLNVLSIYENRKGMPPINPSSGIPSELNVLLTYLEEEVFTDEIRDEMSIFLDVIAKDIQPRLKALKKIGNIP